MANPALPILMPAFCVWLWLGKVWQLCDNSLSLGKQFKVTTMETEVIHATQLHYYKFVMLPNFVVSDVL